MKTNVKTTKVRSETHTVTVITEETWVEQLDEQLENLRAKAGQRDGEDLVPCIADLRREVVQQKPDPHRIWTIIDRIAKIATASRLLDLMPAIKQAVAEILDQT